MQELIKVHVNENGQQTVNAVDLHAFLQVKTELSIWLRRMFAYGFSEGIDYIKIDVPVNQHTTKFEYILALDTAREISMLQRSERGKEARQYFIACEKRLRQIVVDNKSQPINMAQHTIIEVQKTNSKLVNAKNYTEGGAEQTAEYNRRNCLLFTGHTPSEWVERAKKLGLKSKDRSSGKAVLRVLKPEIACAMSFSDSLVHEKGVSQEKAAEIGRTYTVGLFKELLQIGYTVEQLGA